MGKTNIKSRVGEKYKNKEGCEMEIIDVPADNEYIIKFNDGTIVKHLQYINIIRGQVRNPNFPSICGVGYFGQGKYTSKLWSDYFTASRKWRNILNRCLRKNELNKDKTYRDCTVDEHWNNFQNFAQWFEQNWKPWMDETWHIDKDILIKRNKIYSPETCEFVPYEINTLFTKNNAKRGRYPIGVSLNKRTGKFISRMYSDKATFDTPEEAFECYKFHKEKYIKEVADKWQGRISEKIYIAMYNWVVEITD